MKCKHDIDTNYYCMACDKEKTGQDKLPVNKIVRQQDVCFIIQKYKNAMWSDTSHIFNEDEHRFAIKQLDLLNEMKDKPKLRIIKRYDIVV